MLSDPETKKEWDQVKARLRATAVRLVKKCQASSTVRKAVAAAANGTGVDPSRSQIIKVARKMGISEEELQNILGDD